MKTIANLNPIWTIQNYSFKDFKICLEECNSKINFNNYKIRNGTYLFTIDVLKYNIDFKKFDNLLDWYEIESVKIKSKNLSLFEFLYKLNQKLDRLLEKRQDWHIFVEEIKHISGNMFLITLGS